MTPVSAQHHAAPAGRLLGCLECARLGWPAFGLPPARFRPVIPGLMAGRPVVRVSVWVVVGSDYPPMGYIVNPYTGFSRRNKGLDCLNADNPEYKLLTPRHLAALVQGIQKLLFKQAYRQSI